MMKVFFSPVRFSGSSLADVIWWTQASAFTTVSVSDEFCSGLQLGLVSFLEASFVYTRKTSCFSTIPTVLTLLWCILLVPVSPVLPTLALIAYVFIHKHLLVATYWHLCFSYFSRLAKSKRKWCVFLLAMQSKPSCSFRSEMFFA